MTTLRSRALGLLALTAAVAVAVGSTAAAAPPPVSDSAKTDRVVVDTINWTPCIDDFGDEVPPELAELIQADCATVMLPLDYDQPNGEKVAVAVARRPADNPSKRIGSLFMNPGGPGGSARMFPMLATLVFDQEMLDRFDIVGVDPRGVGASQMAQCMKHPWKQASKLAGMDGIPLTAQEKAHYLNSAKTQAQACSKDGQPLSASMSTAEIARDMDVLRRVLGDEKLNYIGVSYGSILGQYYANMFPDRVRALVIDGVLDPTAWTGTPETAHEPITLRIKSAEGAWRALQKTYEMCDAAGPEHCMSAGDMAGQFALIADRLKKQPMTIDLGDAVLKYTYGDFVNETLLALYSSSGPEDVDLMVASLLIATDPNAPAWARAEGTAQASKVIGELREKQKPKSGPNSEYLYQDGFDIFTSVLCTDSLNATDPKSWEPAIKARSEVAPYFAEAWGWQSVVCANRHWKAQDEDAFWGPFTHETSAPVLVVGNYYDPATPYDGGATAAAGLLPNSALLSVDSFGHGAWGVNQCATALVDQYVIDGTLPPAGTECAMEYVPFSTTLAERLNPIEEPGDDLG